MKTLNILIAAALHLAVAAQNKEIESSAKITNITVYTSAAEISCEKEIALPKGKSTVVFTNLTPFIIENSINASVTGAGVNIITVSERINYDKERGHIHEKTGYYQDSIMRLKRELGLILSKIETAETEKGLLFRDESIGGLSSRGVQVSEIEKASAFFSKRYLELSVQLVGLKEKENEIGQRIQNFENQVKELENISVRSTSEIRLMVNNNSERSALFRLKYLVSHAGWAPLYDFRYEGPAKPLQFIFRANVFNATGVPWQDVTFKLSTADPVKGFSLPSLDAEPDNVNAYDNVKFKQVEVVNAITEYAIDQQYSIPSDAKPYLIDVSNYSMPAGFNYLLIPKIDPFGFLMAKIPGWNKYNLIPGTANIYNSGTYMGKTFLNTYAENDTLGLYLGKDKNIQSVRNERSALHKRFLAGNYTLEETFTEITIKNNSGAELRVEVMDQVPVYTKDDKEKLTVYNIEKAVYDKTEGLLTWNYALGAGGTTTINYKYEIKAPKESADGNYGARRKFRTIACPSF